jgi:hypothetical protein
MSLKMYFDANGAQAILTAEKFTGQGPYTLTAFTGAQLGGVYKERKDSYSAITFSLGVGSGFSGMLPDTLKGQRVIHGNRYVGQVVSNTDTTITISNLTYTAASNACYLASYVKLYTPTDFTLLDRTITMISTVNAGEIIHAIPVDTLAMYFGGTAGTNVTKIASIYVKRTTDFEYTLLQISSDDTSLFPYHQTTPDIIFTSGVGNGFSSLPVNGLVGKAVNHNGVYCGIIVSNTDITITLNTTYTNVPATAEIFNIGSLLFSTDGTSYLPVLSLPDMTGAITDTVVYVKDTLNIPSVAINYPSNIIKVSGVEYIA